MTVNRLTNGIVPLFIEIDKERENLRNQLDMKITARTYNRLMDLTFLG